MTEFEKKHNLYEGAEQRFDETSNDEIASQAIFSHSALPFSAILGPDFSNIIWQWGSLSFPNLRWKVHSLYEAFRTLWVDEAKILQVLTAMKSLDIWEALSSPIELTRKGAQFEVYDLLTCMRRPDDWAIQLTIMAQERSIEFIDKLKKSSRFVSFYPYSPIWSNTDQQRDLKILCEAWSLSREEVRNAFDCFKKGFSNLETELENFKWLHYWDIAKWQVLTNQQIIKTLSGTEEKMFLRPFEEQVASGFENISLKLRLKLIHMNSFFRNAIPTFLFRPEQWWDIHVLNWKNKWLIKWYENLFDLLDISDTGNQWLFATALSQEGERETFLQTSKWNYSMQSKNPITWLWQATLLPVWDDISGKKIWMSPFARLQWICTLVQHCDLDSISRDSGKYPEAWRIIKSLISGMREGLDNMKNWKPKKVWENIHKMNKVVIELYELVNAGG